MPYISIEKATQYGYPNPNIQTIQFPKVNFNLHDSKYWLQRHGYLYRNHRDTKNYHRFIQNDVIIGAHYYSKTLPDGVILTFQNY